MFSTAFVRLADVGLLAHELDLLWRHLLDVAITKNVEFGHATAC